MIPKKRSFQSLVRSRPIINKLKKKQKQKKQKKNQTKNKQQQQHPNNQTDQNSELE